MNVERFDELFPPHHHEGAVDEDGDERQQHQPDVGATKKPRHVVEVETREHERDETDAHRDAKEKGELSG